MTQIELLFREVRRDTAISMKEFILAGWSIEECLRYLQLCDNIRSTRICISNIQKKLMSNKALRKIDYNAVSTALFNYESETRRFPAVKS